MLLKYFFCFIAVCSLAHSATLGGKENDGTAKGTEDCASKKTAIELDECLEGKDDKRCHNKFKERDCEDPGHCFFGFEKDSEGCVTGCACAKEGMLEEDIMVTGEEEVKEVEEEYGIRPKSKDATTGPIWNDHCSNGICTVYYQLGAGIPRNRKAVFAIKIAMKALEDNTCIRFKKSNSVKRLVYFVQRGCWSHIGKTRSIRQQISIGRGCEVPGVVMHETMHALGFYHEQARPDRDKHVEILFQNVKPNFRHNFRKMSYTQVNTLGSPYDENSILHYGGKYFSINGKPTIVDRKTGLPVKAQRNFFTDEDLAQINALYKCPPK